VTSFHVRVFAIRRRPGRRAFEVRWRVAGQDRSRSFMTRALAACPRTGTAWTSTGTSFEPRGLKHRPDGTIRIAPSRPSWSACSASTYTRSPPRRTGGCSAAPRHGGANRSRHSQVHLPIPPDRKTGEHVDVLFSVRAQPVARDHINQAVIPALCAKAGVPTADVRGNITSHRARSTIASHLYNAKELMTLFELQAWLGH
jgi:hypothetical protein